jgi:hypothetical protein
MNHRDLLKKYMRLIIAEEGVTYLEYYPPISDRDIAITPDEMSELKALEAEVRKENA